MAASTRESGKITICTVLGSTNGKMDAPIKVSTSMTKNTVKESISGLMAKSMMGSGKMEGNMVRVYTGLRTLNSPKKGSGTKAKETSGSMSE